MNNIGKIYYINLDRRTDRREQMETELTRMGLTGERYSAIEANPSIIGCCQSHLNVLKKAKDEGLANVLILEDDFIFIVDKNELEYQMNSFFR